MKRKFYSKALSFVVVATVMLLAFTPSGFAQQSAGTSYSAFAGAFAMPALAIGTSTAQVTYSAGTVQQGGTSQAIVAGTLTAFAASKSSCAAPAYSSCEIIYWTSGTGLSHTPTVSTAFAAGNVVLGFAVTDGSSLVTGVTPVSLVQPTTPSQFTDCAASASCATSTSVTGAGLKFEQLSVTLVAGAATITGLTGFTINSTTAAPNFTCIAVFDAVTTGAAQVVTCNPVSATSVAVAVGISASSTDKMRVLIVGFDKDPIMFSMESPNAFIDGRRNYSTAGSAMDLRQKAAVNLSKRLLLQ